MEARPIVPAERQLIQGYHAGGFRIAGVRHEGSVLVLPDRTLAWPVAALDRVTADGLAPLQSAEPAVEILLLGCGARFTMIPTDLLAALKAQGIVVEAMTTGAACRTFNLLQAEDRRVAAALIAL